MASLCINSSPFPPPSHPRKLTETSLSSSLLLHNNNNHSLGSSLKPIVVSGDPPSFVSAPGRRILAVGDLHGDLKQARYALEMAGVLSSDGQDLWIGGESVLVQLGDILDRGEDEIAILSLLRSLDQQAKAKGGAVFQVNGNHETMNVEGDFRYVDSGGFDECNDFLEYINGSKNDWEETFTGWVDVSERWKENRTMSKNYWGPWNLVKRQKGLIARSILFRPGGPLARELARHAVVLKVNDWIFCHGGLLPHHVAYGIERMNKEVSNYMRGLHENDNTVKLPFIATRGYDSVVWNRLYSRDSQDLVDYPDKQVFSMLEETLQAVGAKAMVVGHTPQTIGVNCKYNCSIWRIDVGMSSGVLNSRPEVLEIIDNNARVIRSKRDRHNELQAAAYT
ncbi:shewanella-like protein phosphatase 1 isoform X1 [Abrus precatorius]|uniref:Shewanella-like protein phosphatase 1 isoform X1 n=1 Tax=Abrus precatorius TaxID=3816 RepID=A0A8B8MN19_ABRPR|nr:shewanella-like protein phosphatase 1 isoform X1 [Abrus precatorius]XP_027369003.1 shewanella-like protein phosphatase 1 isoform X1 [Abrus precatorius]